ncbi:N5-carboxyaminoimidazole ribonucleotide mutase [hydrothermal vent metagenome]|uniref:N5-carboxyaminoimidazole ribonucleotide mutase n=1 Tax=hydrothermal vent metagenome TaxID=652676 RepID=A0A3B1APX8_9ZZZZ
MLENKNFVAILMGSDSDLPVVQAGIEVLNKLDIPLEVKITSAHRTPEDTVMYIEDAEARGCKVFIAAAGLAAHLAGAVAAHTLKPVIGIPMDGGPLKGMDALLSTVQMPAGIPVATVAIGKAGAKNAAYLAAQILAISDDDVANRVKQERADNADAVRRKDAELQASL